MFKKYSNEEIAQLIYDEFVSDNSLTDDNVKKKYESFEELFWSRHQAEELLQIPELENRQLEIFDIVWFKIIELLSKNLKYEIYCGITVLIWGKCVVITP